MKSSGSQGDVSSLHVHLIMKLRTISVLVRFNDMWCSLLYCIMSISNFIASYAVILSWTAIDLQWKIDIQWTWCSELRQTLYPWVIKFPWNIKCGLPKKSCHKVFFSHNYKSYLTNKLIFIYCLPYRFQLHNCSHCLLFWRLFGNLELRPNVLRESLQKGKIIQQLANKNAFRGYKNKNSQVKIKFCK